MHVHFFILLSAYSPTRFGGLIGFYIFVALKIHKGLSYLTLKTSDLDGMLHFFLFSYNS